MWRIFFDFHASGSRSDHHYPLALAVLHQAQINFLRDANRFLDIKAVDPFALRAGLVGHQFRAQQPVGRVPHFRIRIAHDDSAGLAARARMDLRLDHPALAADFRGAIGRLLGAVCQPPEGNRYIEAAQQFFGLIFVYIHATCSVKRSECLLNGDK